MAIVSARAASMVPYEVLGVRDDPLGDGESSRGSRHARPTSSSWLRRLEEDPDGVDHAAVVPADAHLRTAGIPLLLVSALVVPGLHPLALELRVDGREDFVVADERELDRRVVVARALVVEVVRPCASVVAIDEEVRPPLRDEVLHVGLDRRVLELHVVAVEIDAPRIATLPVRSAFEAIRVDLRCDEHGDLVQECVGRGAGVARSRMRTSRPSRKVRSPPCTLAAKRMTGRSSAIASHGSETSGAEDRVRKLPALAGLTVRPEAHIRARPRSCSR